MKRLIVTGDDFGSSPAVNRAIVEAHRRGILTHASLMVGAVAASEAVAMAREHPKLAVGLHLVLVDGRSTLSESAIPHLVRDGRFLEGPTAAGLRYAFRPAVRPELAREIRAQLQSFAETGLRLSHVDGHHHLHLHPVILSILLDLAPEFRIPAIRLPREELSWTLAIDRTGLPGKLASSVVFQLLHRHARRRLRAAGVDFADRVYGLLQTGKMTEDYLLRLIPRLAAGRNELYCHPSLRGPAAPAEGVTGPGEPEFAALVSPRVRQALEAHGIVLATGPLALVAAHAGGTP